MVSEGPKVTKLDMLKAVLEASDPSSHLSEMPPGVTIHAIEQTQTFGKRRSLEGEVLVETEDGQLHRLTGAELTEWNELLAPFLKKWRLREE